MLPVLLLALGRRGDLSGLSAAVCALRHRAGGLLRFLAGARRRLDGADLFVNVYREELNGRTFICWDDY